MRDVAVYKWVLEDTGEIVDLPYRPEPGQEAKVHIFEDEDLGAFSATPFICEKDSTHQK